MPTVSNLMYIRWQFKKIALYLIFIAFKRTLLACPYLPPSSMSPSLLTHSHKTNLARSSSTVQSVVKLICYTGSSCLCHGITKQLLNNFEPWSHPNIKQLRGLGLSQVAYKKSVLKVLNFQEHLSTVAHKFTGSSKRFLTFYWS